MQSQPQHHSAERRSQPPDIRRLTYTRAEVASVLGVSKATVARLERDGRLRSIRLRSGRRVHVRPVYRVQDVKALLRSE